MIDFNSIMDEGITVPDDDEEVISTDNRWSLCDGDIISVLEKCESSSFDACLSDPPYGLSFKYNDWDFEVPGPAVWSEVYRVLRPGAFLLAFGGTRTYHRLVCALEDSGFQIRDTLMWLYSTGFPKAHSIERAVDAHITTGKSDSTRTSTGARDRSGQHWSEFPNSKHTNTTQWERTSEKSRPWCGYYSQLKPSWEPITLAMKPFESTYAANALQEGVSGLNIGGGRWGDSRWPTNILLDKDVSNPLERFFYCPKPSKKEKNEGLVHANPHDTIKPIRLTKWLATLLLPPEKLSGERQLLVPFCGSGSEIIGGLLAGWDYAVGVDINPEYLAISDKRLKWWTHYSFR